MKKYIVFIIVLLITSCKKSLETNINKIEIHSVDFNTETAIDVDCNDFETTFNKKIKIYSIVDKSVLNKFETLLKRTKKSTEIQPINVRKKIIIYYKNNLIDTLCLDRFNIVINNQFINKENDLLDFAINL